MRPGDPEWEQLGICEYITKPRIAAAITGKTPDGEPIKGDYKFTDEFPMADGFEENVEFFTLTYEAPLRVATHREFAEDRAAAVAAGRVARAPDRRHLDAGWDVADAYGVLADLDQSDEFLEAVARDATTSRSRSSSPTRTGCSRSIVRELPDHVEPVRLYEAYLRNFEIEPGGVAR